MVKKVKGVKRLKVKGVKSFRFLFYIYYYINAKKDK